MKKYFFSAIIFILLLFIYLSHLSSGVYGGDAGDFLSAIISIGVAHPSGYPLFTMLGIMANSLPFALSPAFKVGLLSIVFSAGACATLFLLATYLAKNTLTACITSFSLAFSYIFWLHAEHVEVFALNNFFFILLLFLGVLYYITNKKKLLYILSFIVGLSFSNHEITLLVLPSLFILVLSKNWKVLTNAKLVLSCVGLFFLGLLPYLYIPFAAAHHPYLNWDNADTVQNFFRLLLRQDYGWSPSTTTSFLTRFLAVATYGQIMIEQFTFTGSMLIVVGMIALLGKKKFALFFCFFVGFFLTGPLYILYGLTPIYTGFTLGVLERFYMVSGLFLLLFFPFGIETVVEIIIKVVKNFSNNEHIAVYKIIFTLLFFLIPVSLFLFNSTKTNLSAVHMGDNLGKDILSPLPHKAFLLLHRDNILFDTQYVQLAYNLQPHVIVANLLNLPQNEFYAKTRQSMILEKKKNPDLQTMETISKQMPIFSWDKFFYADQGDLQWVPYGLGFRLISKSTAALSESEFIAGQNSIWKQFHIPNNQAFENPANHGLIISDVAGVYAQGFINIANYLRTHYQDINAEKSYIDRALLVDNAFENAYQELGYYYGLKKDCNQAEKAFTTVLSLNPISKSAYVSLYVLQIGCFNNENEALKIAKKYQILFGESIQKDIKELPNQEKTSGLN